MAERYTPEQLALLNDPRFSGGGLNGPAAEAIMERFLNQQRPSTSPGGRGLDALAQSMIRRLGDRAPTTQDWIDAQGPAPMGAGLVGAMPPGFTLVPNGTPPGMGEPLPPQYPGIPAGWNGTMPGQGATRKAEAAQELAGGEGAGSILPYTGMPRFLTELGLRLAASKRPDFLGALGESALGSFGSTEQAEERQYTRKIAEAQAKRQGLLAQAQVNQLNAAAMEALDRIGKPKDVKVLTTADGIVSVLQDGQVKIIIDPRTGKPMQASDPDSLKVLSSIIESSMGDIDEISENVGEYTKVIKQFRQAGSDLYQPKESVKVKPGSSKGKADPTKTPGGFTVKVTPNK